MIKNQLDISQVPKRSGIYFFYLPKLEVGYIGRSRNLQLRYHQHTLEGSHRKEIANYAKAEDDLEFMILEFTDGYKAKDQKLIEYKWIKHYLNKGVKLLNRSDPRYETDYAEPRAVVAYDKDTLEFVGEWESIWKASKDLKIYPGNIVNSIKMKVSRKGKRSYSLKGLLFFYKSDYTLEKLQEKKHLLELSISNKKINSAVNAKLIGKLNSVAVNQYSISGAFIKRWESQIEVARILGIKQPSINQCLKGKRKSTGGYIWKYADEP